MTKESTEKQKAQRVESLRQNIDELRDKVEEDLGESDEDMETFLIALAVKMIDETYARIGNRESVKERSHYGVSQWEPRHLSFNGDSVSIDYTGKKGVEQKKKIEDKTVVDALKEIREEKAEDECLFCWEDENGRYRRVSPDDINDYLDDFDVTSKDIRGFHANDEMKDKLEEIREKNGDLPEDEEEREEQLEKEFKEALDEVSELLGHQASTLKNSYLVPHFEEEFLESGDPPSDFFKEGYFGKEAIVSEVVSKVRRDSVMKRTAEEIPKTVERYVEEHEEQGMGKSKSYALAWSRYCADNPDSPHCKQDEYFPNRPEVAEGIRESSTCDQCSKEARKMSDRTKRRIQKKALRGDFSSGRAYLMYEWDKVQNKLGHKKALYTVLDWLGGKKAIKYLKYVTDNHIKDYDFSMPARYREIAQEIMTESAYGANQLGDAVVKGMSVDELDDFIEDMKEERDRPARSEEKERAMESSSSSLKDDLIKLGSKNPQLQKHIRPVLNRLEE